MSKVYSRTFEWRFDSPPSSIWRAMADTARFNEAAGLPVHKIDEEGQPDGSVRYFAEARKGPFALAWEEIPVEWVDGKWFRHMRVFSKGPLRTLCATLRLEPDGDSGAIGHYTIDASAANPIGTVILATAFFDGAKKSFDALAASARDWAAGRREMPFDTPPVKLTGDGRTRLDVLTSRIEASAHAHGLVRRLVDWMLQAQEIDLMRIRPLALARRWDARERDVIELCLQSVKDGLLESRWDLLCPRCRGAKLTVTSLDTLPRGAHCSACNIGYDREFATNVELTFHPSPAVREVVDGEFCLFGPMTTPHVKVQVTLEPGETRTIEAPLATGDYRLRTLEIGGASDITHESGGFPGVTVTNDMVTAGAPSGEGEIDLANECDRRRTVIIESRDWVQEALTAHRVTTMQAFRDLFPSDVLGSADEVGISQVTLMFTDLKGSTEFYERVGDSAAYHLVHDHFAFLARVVREHDGAIVKTIGDAVMAAFTDPANGARAALAVQAGVDEFNRGTGTEDIVIKLGVHCGPCIVVTLNDQLDYFGSTVNMAARLQGESIGGDIVFSEDLLADPIVSTMVRPSELSSETRFIKGFSRPITFRRYGEKAQAAN